jgi:hypothetical protein
LYAARQSIHDSRRVIKLENERFSFGFKGEFGAPAKRVDQPRAVRQGNEQQLAARDRCKPIERGAVIENQPDRLFRIGCERPFRVDKPKPPAVLAGYQHEQINSAVIGYPGRTMGEGAGSIVGIGAARPKAVLERPNRAGRTSNRAP